MFSRVIFICGQAVTVFIFIYIFYSHLCVVFVGCNNFSLQLPLLIVVVGFKIIFNFALFCLQYKKKIGIHTYAGMYACGYGLALFGGSGHYDLVVITVILAYKYWLVVVPFATWHCDFSEIRTHFGMRLRLRFNMSVCAGATCSLGPWRAVQVFQWQSALRSLSNYAHIFYYYYCCCFLKMLPVVLVHRF